MHEKLNEQIEAMNEKVVKITNECLEMLEKDIEDEKQKTNGDWIAAVRRTGEALKALADGLESYRAVTKAIKQDANPRQMTSASPVVGGQIR